MVLALGVLAVLAVLAMVVVAIVVSEKQTALSDYSADRSFYSADAATEAGVNWIRSQPIPPPIMDASSNVYLANGFTALSNDHNYKFDVQFVRKQLRPGWSVEYKDYVFDVAATGTSVQGSESKLDVNATRLYREGY
jgi:Tfp pilus assembly protein PilV